jgi:hypothetical protein
MFKTLYYTVLLFLVFSTFSPEKAFGYANYIGHGYNSCMTCHYNPFGNGPINDYGRAISATAISSRGFYKDSKPEDLIGKESGFFFTQPLGQHIRPFASYRGLLLKRNFGEENETSEYIHMQADLNLVLKFGQNDKYISSVTFGYAPIPRAIQNTPAAKDVDKYRTREHYVGYRPSNTWGFYAGLMDKPFGVKIVEHTAYARTTPQLTMDDQAHGFTVHYNTPQLEGGINYFVGNLSQDAPLRMKGIAGTFEYTLFEKNRPGLSFMKQGNEYIDLSAFAAHIRTGLENGNSLIFELGRVTKTPKSSGLEKTEYYANFQNHIRALRGVYLLNSIEYFKNDLDKSYRVRFGPSVQYFPVSKVELRVDLNNTRSFSEQSSVKDRWDLMAQVHLWL